MMLITTSTAVLVDAVTASVVADASMPVLRAKMLWNVAACALKFARSPANVMVAETTLSVTYPGGVEGTGGLGVV